MGDAKRRQDLEKEEIRDLTSHARTGDIIKTSAMKTEEERLMFHNDPNFIGMIEIKLWMDGRSQVSNTHDVLLCLKMLDEAKKVVKGERVADMVVITPINEINRANPLSVVEIHYFRDGKIRVAMPQSDRLTIAMLGEARKVIMRQTKGVLS